MLKSNVSSNKKLFVISLIFVVVCIIISCQKILPAGEADDQTLDGTIEGLTYDQNLQHHAGDAAFGEVFTASTGLGPIFVSASCESCHAGDGKGVLFTTLTRFGQTDSTGNHFLNEGGPQLQNIALPGYTPEQIPAGASFAIFTPPGNTGLGFIEAVPDAAILTMAVPNDMDEDGISGVPDYNTIPSFVIPFENALTSNGKYICRFGKKAAVYRLLQQVSNAYNQDMGITSSFVPLDVYSHIDIDPEVPANKVNDLVFYLQTLKAPVQREPDNPEVTSGSQLFVSIGCEKCHKQTLTTGTSSSLFYPTKNFILLPICCCMIWDRRWMMVIRKVRPKPVNGERRRYGVWDFRPNRRGVNIFYYMTGGRTVLKMRSKCMEERRKTAVINFHCYRIRTGGPFYIFYNHFKTFYHQKVSINHCSSYCPAVFHEQPCQGIY